MPGLLPRGEVGETGEGQQHRAESTARGDAPTRGWAKRGFRGGERTHQGIDGLIPADRFFDAESEVRRSMEARVAENALSLAKEGAPAKPFYLTGRVGDQSLSLHTEGEKVVLTRDDGSREEVELTAPPPAVPDQGGEQ